MTDTAIIVRTIRQLDSLVEEHIIKGFSKEILDRNPGLAPKYSTWLGLEPVVRNREGSGYWWLVASPQRPGEPYMAELIPHGKMPHEVNSFARSGPTEPITRCLAALASVGVRVRCDLDYSPHSTRGYTVQNSEAQL
jgi:hypothetical protein